ncbi:dTDP-4-dehydrorhamnose reductase [Desulfocucumis palustris]|uniref:dTDP-4-dehydrorhamnose reductase n=1 Tax=Desulfocucumis palustris TaxID=1898651 RepID=A0A2L2XBD8_9FIRM|nr:dTDP-4-dehydrorhamnose reductase [Desulfocucumis palustris]GBF33420.1 dTDP-4-dehydrorhamnose reductase [Desulfocucumis palustris]
MIVAVTGARGMLGSDIEAEMENRGHEVLPLGKNELDITDFTKVKKVLSRERPDVIINCAAYTDVEGAEDNPQQAISVNGLGARNLALACHEYEIDLVHISTDYVFDGKKEGTYGIFDGMSPLNSYGFSKMLGERYVTALLHRYYLIRTSWLFGLSGDNFVEKVLRLSNERSQLHMVEDQVGSPTYTVDLAKLVGDLIKTRCFGIYHATNQGYTSWCGFAREIVALKHLNVHIEPVSSFNRYNVAARPANSVLDPFPLKETLGYLLPPWEDALGRYMEHRAEVDL